MKILTEYNGEKLRYPEVLTAPADTKVTFHRDFPGHWEFRFDGMKIGHVYDNRPYGKWFIETSVNLKPDIGQGWAYFESFKSAKEHIRRVVREQDFCTV